MLPGLEPLTPLSVALTMLGLVLGVALWTWRSNQPAMQQRIQADSGGVRKQLLRQMSTVIFGLLGLLIFGGIVASTALAPLITILSIIGGMAFWGYVGALILLIMRGGGNDAA